MREFRTIEDPIGFLSSLGGMHDVRINKIVLDRRERSLAAAVADLNANFTGLPYDPGRQPGTLLFRGVMSASLAIDYIEGILISDAEVLAENGMFRFEADLTSGAKGIVFTFESLDFVE